MKAFNLILASGLLASKLVNANGMTCDFEPANENQGHTICPPESGNDVDIVL